MTKAQGFLHIKRQFDTFAETGQNRVALIETQAVMDRLK